jgi:fucose 4-O-acetylase-like acetyltransferase
MGPVQEFAGLNSFFQGYARRDQTLQKLEQRLAKLGPAGLYLMVTHQVVIQAVTQLTVASGECVAYNFQTKQAIEITVD